MLRFSAFFSPRHCRGVVTRLYSTAKNIPSIHDVSSHIEYSEKVNGMWKTKSTDEWKQFFDSRAKFGVLGHMAFEFVDLKFGVLESRMVVQDFHRAPNGYLHAATHVLLADTAAGFATFCHLPSAQHHFTTVELKHNFFSTASVGDELRCIATLLHAGKSTQIWDCNVYNVTTGKLISSFRNTQIVLDKSKKHGDSHMHSSGHHQTSTKHE